MIKAMLSSGSILFKKSTLPFQKVAFIHHFKVMAKAVVKIGVKTLLPRPI